MTCGVPDYYYGLWRILGYFDNNIVFHSDPMVLEIRQLQKLPKVSDFEILNLQI